MGNEPYIGTGRNPEGVDLPLGFGMRLAQSPKAVDAYGSLNRQNKAKVVQYIQKATTGDAALERINTAVNSLTENDLGLFGI